ncbi:ly6/PLAUR domain-containing protein 1 [Tachysurus ichikawai]
MLSSDAGITGVSCSRLLQEGNHRALVHRALWTVRAGCRGLRNTHKRGVEDAGVGLERVSGAALSAGG